MNCTLDQDSIDISNSFMDVTLTSDPKKMVELLEAINRGRLSIGPEELYPKKYLYISNKDSHSFEL